jgi:3-oxosteroid 1-dehydrogenase
MVIEVDFLSVGSGIGGFAAAIAAHDAGLSSAVIEKAPVVGGVCAYSQGELWVPGNHLIPESERAAELEAARRYVDFIAGPYGEPRLRDRFLSLAPVALRYTAERAGIRWNLCRALPDYYYPSAPGSAASGRAVEVEPFDGPSLGDWRDRTRRSPSIPSGITTSEIFAWGGMASLSNWDMALFAERIGADQRTLGPGMMASFVKAAVIDRQIPVYTSTTATSLIREDGRVAGVIADRDGAAEEIRARRGVLLATGGYDRNAEMLRAYEHVAELETGCPVGLDGDHLVMAPEIGAQVALVPPDGLCKVYGYQIPGEEADGLPYWRFCSQIGLPHAIVVDGAGRRFADESFYRDHQTRFHEWDGLTQDFRHRRAVAILDQSHRDKYPLGSSGPGDALPEGLATRHETLEGLAEAVGLPVEGLLASVERFNRHCDSGADPDFGRGSRPWANVAWGDGNHEPNPNLGRIEKPPFYALELTVCSAGINAAGLRIDEHAAVVDVRGRPIPGLYAAGNAAAWIDIGAGYQSGMANTRGLAWGFAAGCHAAGIDPARLGQG